LGFRISPNCVKEGFLHLTTVLDLYDRKNHRLEFNSGMSVEETSLAAWRMAKNRSITKDCYFILTEVFNNASKKKLTNVVDSCSQP
jgi:hypothetical protein